MSHGDDNLPVGFSNPVLNHFLKNIEQDDGKIALGLVQFSCNDESSTSGFKIVFFSISFLQILDT